VWYKNRAKKDHPEKVDVPPVKGRGKKNEYKNRRERKRDYYEHPTKQNIGDVREKKEWTFRRG